MRKNDFSVTQRVVPRGRVEVVNGETPSAVVAGESVVCTNLREVDDALEVVGMPVERGVMTAGETLLAIDGDRVLTLSGREIRCDGAVVTTASADVIAASVVGRFVVVSTGAGPLVLRYTAGAYRVLNIADAVPRLRLTMSGVTSSDVEIDAITFADGYTRWQAPLDAADIAAVTAAVRAGWSAFETTVRSRGRYCAPVLARYVVRLWDDTVLWASRPVLLGGDLLSDSRLAAAEVTVDNNLFTASAATTIRARSFSIGVDVRGGIAAEWHGLVKSIDIYAASAVTVLDLAATAGYRCATVTTSTPRRYLLDMEPATLSADAVIRRLTSARWRRVASTTRLEALDNGTFDAAAITGDETVDISYFAPAVTAASRVTTGGTMLENGGRLYDAVSRERLTDGGWTPLSLLADNVVETPVTAVIETTLATDNGTLTLRRSTTLPCSATALGPLVTFPDPRATSMTVTVGQLTRTVQLAAWHDAAMAYFIEPTLQSLALAAGTPATGDDTEPETDTPGLLTVSAVGNPFVTGHRDIVVGHDILHLGAAGRPVYSGGFGRYPVYLFTTGGIYALPQNASGVPGEARLIDGVIADADVRPVAARQRLWFVDIDGRLVTLSGTALTTVLNDSAAVTLAYDSRHDEVLALTTDGTVTAVQRSGRSYRRTLTLAALLSGGGQCLGIDATSRALLDFGSESAATVPIEYVSRQLIIDDWLRRRARHVEWCFFGEGVDIRLTLRGERGRACHGFTVTALRLRGNVYAPTGTPVVAQPARTLRLHLSGNALSGALLMPILLTLSR